MSIDFSTLNEAQLRAVECTEGPLLVLAGAGSGKTRVLTYRIANMIENKGVEPWEILAITFTNKAANEMKERLSSLIGTISRGMWVSTFHKCCGRIIRANAKLIGFTENFTIYDSQDQKRLIKAIFSDLALDDRRYQPNAILNIISNAKNDCIYAEGFGSFATTPLERTAAIVYVEYQKRLKAANALDFDDMLLHAYTLLKDFPEVKAAYQDRFHYILVDEYQDTNHVQYEICKMLADKHKNIMVVGDDDQSIYSWRGADVQNILDFERDYKNCTTIKLEENYRSTKNILEAANAVIAKNKKRKQKHLFSNGDVGEKVGVYYANDERDEGRWIASEIDKALKKGELSSLNEVAILYRTNAQSRTLEDMMLRSGIPYRIVGGQKFFDRKEIRDVMAYLSLITNNDDDVSFERIINTPKRGIGPSTIERIRTQAAYLSTSELVAAESLIGSGELRPKVKQQLIKFITLIRDAKSYGGTLKDIINLIISNCGITAELEEQRTDEARERIGNIEELLTVVEEFSEKNLEEDLAFEAPSPGEEQGERVSPELTTATEGLPAFIEWVRLRTDLDSLDESGAAVTLMTCHASKGLEFEQVYLTGMEEGLFPSLRFDSDEDKIEEERRLAYVSFTRAKKRLVLIHTQSRRLYGTRESSPASRFLTDIPPNLRENLGIGSSGFEGTGFEKRGSRRGIAGSATEFFNSGRVSTISSSSTNRRKKNSTPISFEGEVSCSSEPEIPGYQQISTGSLSDPKHFNINDLVEHKVFGRGIVVDLKEDRISILFEKTGQTKQLLVDYAPIVKIV